MTVKFEAGVCWKNEGGQASVLPKMVICRLFSSRLCSASAAVDLQSMADWLDLNDLLRGNSLSSSARVVRPRCLSRRAGLV